MARQSVADLQKWLKPLIRTPRPMQSESCARVSWFSRSNPTAPGSRFCSLSYTEQQRKAPALPARAFPCSKREAITISAGRTAATGCVSASFVRPDSSSADVPVLPLSPALSRWSAPAPRTLRQVVSDSQWRLSICRRLPALPALVSPLLSGYHHPAPLRSPAGGVPPRHRAHAMPARATPGPCNPGGERFDIAR